MARGGLEALKALDKELAAAVRLLVAQRPDAMGALRRVREAQVLVEDVHRLCGVHLGASGSGQAPSLPPESPPFVYEKTIAVVREAMDEFRAAANRIEAVVYSPRVRVERTASDTELFSVVAGILARNGVTLEQLRSRVRDAGLATVRVEAAKCLRDLGFTTVRIGAFLRRNHASVIAYLRQPGA